MLEVYFHVGLGKTGSKYLQFEFFPKLYGIEYIHMSKYKKSVKIIWEKGKGKFLVSREFDRQFEREVDWFSKYFPFAGPIMVLRRHDEWILSQYKRYIKNGHQYSFDEFFNFDNSGFFKIEHMLFYRKIKFLESKFNKKPLILLYDELKNNPYSFLDKIALYVGAKYDKSRIGLGRKHESYSSKQLKVINVVAKRVNLVPGDSKLKKYLFVYPIRYPLLFVSKYLPDKAVPKVEIFPSEDKLRQIREFFREDWNMCVDYVKRQNVY